MSFSFKVRRLTQRTFANTEEYRARLAATPYETMTVVLLGN
jgi:hypothetical protein